MANILGKSIYTLGPTVLTGTSAVALVTAWSRLLIRNLIVTNRSGSAVNVTIRLGGAGTEAANVVVPQTSLSANTNLTDYLDGMVIEPGQTLYITAGTADVINVTLTLERV